MRQHIKYVQEHITKRFTGRFDFVEFIWYRAVPTRADAKKLEKYLKSLTHNSK